jgi:hypothetical protein
MIFAFQFLERKFSRYFSRDGKRKREREHEKPEGVYPG